MVTLNNLVMFFPDTIALATAPEKWIFHSCPATRTQLDIDFAAEIATSVLWAIGIIGGVIILCLAIAAISKYMQQRLRLKYEDKKRRHEQEVQEYQNRFDSAWRCIESYKKKESGHTENELNMAKASWKFLTEAFNDTQIPESNRNR